MQHLSSRGALAALLASICAVAGTSTALAADQPSRERKAPDRALVPVDRDTTCVTEFTDTAGERWDILADGGISDGTEDAYDTYGGLYLGDFGADNWVSFPEVSDCTLEDNGRELVTPATELTFTNGDAEDVTVEVQRKIYVPESGQAFARWLDVLHNPGDTPITFNYNSYGEYGEIGDGYADRSIDSTNGDGIIDVGEAWGAFRNDFDGNAHVASLWDGVGADGWDQPYSGGDSIPGRDGNDYADFVYDAITLLPGETATYMHIEHQKTVPPTVDPDVRGSESAEDAAAFEDVVDFARRNERGSVEFFAGMSADEIQSVRNWLTDSDRDGVLDVVDNCASAANADQADLDGDGEGNACDDDADGDGLTNAQETRLGMNAQSVDTDGDSVVDGLDRCPTRAGTSADGCPAFTAQSAATSVFRQRLRAPRLTAEVVRKRTSGTVRLTTSGRLSLPAGVTKQDGCEGQVLVTIKAGKRTISTRRAALNADCTYRTSVTFAALGRLGKSGLNVQATFQGNASIFRQRAKRVSVAGR